MGPRPLLWILHAKQRLMDQNNKSLFPTHDLSFCACTRACLASETLVSMDHSPHLWFLHANSSFWTRITNFYGYQISPVVLCIQISVISTRKTSLYGFQPSFEVLGSQNSDLKTKIACVYGSQTALLIFFISLYGSQP